MHHARIVVGSLVPERPMIDRFAAAAARTASDLVRVLVVPRTTRTRQHDRPVPVAGLVALHQRTALNTKLNVDALMNAIERGAFGLTRLTIFAPTLMSSRLL